MGAPLAGERIAPVLYQTPLPLPRQGGHTSRRVSLQHIAVPDCWQREPPSEMSRHDGHTTDRYGPKGPFISGFPSSKFEVMPKHTNILTKEGHW